MQQEFNLNALTSYDRNYWRVDWFGYLNYFDEQGGRRSEPLVDVFLSQFKRPPNSASLKFKNSTLFENTTKVQVPVSYLKVLRLGDVWHNGARIPLTHDKSMRATFSHLHIDDTNTQTLISSAYIGDKNYILPFSHHPYHSSATKTYCEVITLPNGNLIVIPHYVILQAYFSTSQYVLTQLFKFGLDLGSIYDSHSSYIDDEGKAFVLLKKWTHDKAAPEVARIAFDKQAYRAVSGISKQFVLQENRNEPIRPKTKIPFSGVTNLDVFGKWYPIQDKMAFVVYDILGCTASYPFNVLEHFRDNPGDKGENNTQLPQKLSDGGRPNKPKPKPINGHNIELKPENEPSNQIDELELMSREGTRFPDLMDKKITKQRQQPHKSEGNIKGSPHFVDVSEGNTGDGDSKGTSAPVNFVSSLNEEDNRYIFDERICRLALFNRLLQYLKNRSRVQEVNFIQVNENLGPPSSHYSYFPKTYSMSGRASSWQYINYTKGARTENVRFIHRKAIIAEIGITNGKYIYLVETERRCVEVANGWVELDSPSLFLATSDSANMISAYQFETLLEQCCSDRGSWNHEVLPNYIQSFSIKHPSNAALDEYPQRQASIIEKYIGFDFE